MQDPPTLLRFSTPLPQQTPRDYARAYELLTKAVAGGDEVVRPWLQNCRQEMSKADTSPAPAAAPNPK